VKETLRPESKRLLLKDMEKMHLRALNLSPPPSETIFSKMLFKTDSRPH
jgi:hypothetical protein